MNDPTPNRIPWVDALRGLAILLVVVAHTELPPANWLYTFHVPLFFVLSGLLSALSRSRTPVALAAARARSLLLPYLALSILGIACLVVQVWIRGGNDLPSLTLNQLRAGLLALRGESPFHGDLWFLPCLFLTELSHRSLSWALPRLRLLIPLLSGTAFLLGLAPGAQLPTPLPWCLDLLPATLFFYSLGDTLQALALTGRLQQLAWAVFPAGFAGTVLALLINGRVDLYHGMTGNALAFLAGAVSGSLALLSIAPLLARATLLSSTGRHTLAILGFHHWYGFGLAGLIAHHVLAWLSRDSALWQGLNGLLLVGISLGLVALGVRLSALVTKGARSS